MQTKEHSSNNTISCALSALYKVVSIFGLICLLPPTLVAQEGTVFFENPQLIVSLRSAKSRSAYSELIVTFSAGPAEYNAGMLSNPPRLVLDISGSSAKRPQSFRVLDDKFLERVRIGVHDDKVRLVLDLREAGLNHKVFKAEASVRVRIFAKGSVSGRAASPPMQILRSGPPPKRNKPLSGESFVRGIDGYIQNRNYIDRSKDGSAEQTYELRNEALIGADLDLGFSAARVSARQELDYGKNDNDGFEEIESPLRLWDAYLDIGGRDYSLRIGNQIMRWGKGDELNPTDVFTPEDLSEFVNLERAERKLPVPAADLRYYLNQSWTLQGVWIPVFEESKFAEPGQDWELYFSRILRAQTGLAKIPERRPARTFENSVGAARLLHQAGWGDISFMYAYHYDENPAFIVNQTAGPGEPPVTMEWVREHTVGVDFETTVGEIGLRSEMAYTTDRPYFILHPTQPDFLVRRDTLSAVLGADYTLPWEVYINLQVVEDFVPDRPEGMYYDSSETSLTLRLWRKFLREQLKLQATGRYFLTEYDNFYKLESIYELTENLFLTAGFMMFAGDSDRVFGQYDNNDQFFFNTRYYF
ncbi:MAG: AMIN domain-containing protein [Deltaproteobacteria bacterium]|nr:AMIN domain-containing protein [Deltaproteobacteria bacterium]